MMCLHAGARLALLFSSISRGRVALFEHMVTQAIGRFQECTALQDRHRWRTTAMHFWQLCGGQMLLGLMLPSGLAAAAHAPFAILHACI